jgi:dimeric dUTPase (all-alpha-NTP-PPase superfamily)
MQSPGRLFQNATERKKLTLTLPENKLTEQLALQSELNDLINPDWLDAGNNWTDAMMVEAVEALEHYGWKWWKKQASDMPQARIELVDIWHFILSHALDKARGDLHAAVVSISVGLDHPQNSVFVGYAPRDVSVMNPRELLRTFICLAAGGIVSITTFEYLMESFGLKWDELHRMYLAKNVLNLFRQQNGYQHGLYTKSWMGKEDNEVLQGLIDSRPDATAEQLFAQLNRIYSNIKGIPA